MVSPLFYYQLAVLALAWLFVLLHVTGAKPGLPAPPMPAKPKRKRSTEPKPFAGLTQKPRCALCERETVHPQAPPPVPPASMPSTHRRPREVDTSLHFCPHSGVTIVVGWGLGIFGPTAIPVAAPGVSSTVPLVKGTFWKRTARSSTANRQQSH
jgi:hypothetical protein